jgi:hypothetical protein
MMNSGFAQIFLEEPKVKNNNHSCIKTDFIASEYLKVNLDFKAFKKLECFWIQTTLQHNKK